MDNKNKFRKTDKPRLTVQLVWTVLTNSFVTGFAEGKIYTGKFKSLCLPGLNCYSCPGALGACPIGSLQAMIGSEHKIALYVSGFLIFIGALFGRLVCGWLCPFGLVQDLLDKIPFPKKIKTFKGDKLLRYLKYVILLVFVVILPLFALDDYGTSIPWFCKYICPSGMLFGGIPLVAVNEGIKESAGFLFAYKGVILVATILLAIIIYRPFCKYICPLGAIYALFNKVSPLRIRNDKEKCIGCKKCEKACKMNIDVLADLNSPECIRCGLCVKNCPTESLSMRFFLKNAGSVGEKSKKEEEIK